MLSGGTVTIYVSDMERAIRFYGDTLGLRVGQRGGPGFTTVDAGGGLVLGLHAPHPGSPQPGQRGATSLGFNVTEPIEQVVARLQERGVEFTAPIRGDGPVKLAFFADPDGNPLYLAQTPRG